jgi:hypothetical protein
MVRRRGRNVWLCCSKQIVLLGGLFDCLSIWRSGLSFGKLRHLLQVRVKLSLSVHFMNIHCRKSNNGLQNRSQESVVLDQGKAFAWWKGTVCFLRHSSVGQGLIHKVSRSHTTTHHSQKDSSGRVISSSQRLLPDNTQHSQQTNLHAPRWYSNPQSQ